MSVTARLDQIELPFRFRFDHAITSRAACDSMVLRIEADGHCGWGEALLRSYVGGLPDGPDLLRSAARIAADLVSRLGGPDWRTASGSITTLDVEDFERPLLCAVESALIDLECQRSALDVYDVLDLQPIRQEVTYGVIIPILPAEKARDLLEQTRTVDVPAVRIKLSRDKGQNQSILALSREILGDIFDIRVDVNSSWREEEIEEQLDLCRRYGITTIEDPGHPGLIGGVRDQIKEGFVFVADESFVSEKDLQRIIKGHEFAMLNIRLAKNGGILRCVELANRAASEGLTYGMGCHPGETGILSALGRVAASIMPEPVYVDGSYDSILLSDNLTTENFGFGARGLASIMRDRRIGFEVDLAKVALYSRDFVEFSL